VLVCPDCQRAHNWSADLDACPSCDSTMLARALGVTTCRVCSWSAEVEAEGAQVLPDAHLAQDVEAALDRLRKRRHPESLG
jgi:ribosomal protein L37AE/L43A